MKLDDLKKMNIPELSPIEIEVDAETIPPETRTAIGYFRRIEEEKGQSVRLTFYGSPEAAYRIPTRSSYYPIDQIRRVSILVRAQNQ